jgi:hypothetical protein
MAVRLSDAVQKDFEVFRFLDNITRDIRIDLRYTVIIINFQLHFLVLQRQC